MVSEESGCGAIRLAQQESRKLDSPGIQAFPPINLAKNQIQIDTN